MRSNSIYIGFDPRETAAFAVARHSARRNMTQPIMIRGLVLSDLKAQGLYTRPMEMREGPTGKPVMWDLLSDAAMSTEHANARFLVPKIAARGWALFMDGDMLVRGNLVRMFKGLDESKAVYCVKHHYDPPAGVKMDGQTQSRYARKNWSSFIVFNVGHPANDALTLEMINTLPGRDLHRICWLDDAEIGELDASWNFLVGHTSPEVNPDVVHFTEGVPDMPGFENVPFADEWRAEIDRWAA